MQLTLNALLYKNYSLYLRCFNLSLILQKDACENFIPCKPVLKCLTVWHSSVLLNLCILPLCNFFSCVNIRVLSLFKVSFQHFNLFVCKIGTFSTLFAFDNYSGFRFAIVTVFGQSFTCNENTIFLGSVDNVNKAETKNLLHLDNQKIVMTIANSDLEIDDKRNKR